MPDAKNEAGCAVWATDEWLIAPKYLMQISAQLAFCYMKLELLTL